LRIEAAGALRHLLAENTIGANDLRLATPHPSAIGALVRRGVNHQKMIANAVVAVLVATAQLCGEGRLGRHFPVEHVVAQTLGQLDVGPRARQPHLELAHAAIHGVRR
jgi:hypothetical protein